MNMEQQRALNALEPYLALAKSATSPRAAADLITRATSASQTYVFAELLQSPNIQSLAKSPEYISYLKILEIFAWGTLNDYNEIQGLPALTPEQKNKLLLLSLLPLCTSPSTLNYTSIKQRLSLPSDQAIEALVTTAIYENLIQGHLDPQHRIIRISSVAPLRDLAPNSIPALRAVLDEWEGRCTQTLEEIEAQIMGIKHRANEARKLKKQKEQRFEDIISGKFDDKKGEGEEDMIEMEGQGDGSATGKIKGLTNALFGKTGKRAASTNLEAGDEEEIDDDSMDLDDEGLGRGGSRGVKRQGRSGGLRHLG